MASFFDNVKNKVSAAGKSAAKMTKEIADTAKLKAEINGAKSTVENTYSDIGKLYYEQKKDVPDEGYAELVAKISEALALIEKKEQEIREIRGEIICPQCGKHVTDKNISFCPACGARVRDEQPEEEQQQQ